MSATNYPPKVILTEVGPRDGLQNEKGVIPTAEKLAFINALVESGVTRLEAGSFVSPKWVPQMADTAELFDQIKPKAGVRYIALVPNPKGLEIALQHPVKDIAVFTAASETFTKKNINRTIEESLSEIGQVLATAKQHGLWVRGYVSTCFACPYEGAVKPERVLEVAERLVQAGVDELSIGDTIGVANPKQVESISAMLLEKIPEEKIALHFHDTRGTALANVVAGLRMGILKYDASAGGLGGCPYAPGASGNLATEDLLNMLEGMGIDTGVNLEKLAQASLAIGKTLGKALPSKVLQAMAEKCI